MKTATRLSLSLILLSTLGGCAVYGPGYYPAGGYYANDPYYTQPAYAAPLYVGPPLFFSFGYRSGGDRGFRGEGHGFRGGGRGGGRGGR